MGERRNYIALDWVTAEIEETLQQARQSLDDYVSDREDVTKLRFCLTYAHQVHYQSTLQAMPLLFSLLRETNNS